ncbi:MAG: PilZ domain-containing protein [Terriglobia bacterium]
MNDASNQRRFSRVQVQLFVEIRHDDIHLSSNKTHDVSMKGLFVHTGKTLPIGTQCNVKLMLEGSQGEQSIEVRGQVVRVTNAGMAVEFHESDLDSYQRLRNLILFNSPNAAQAEDELDGHVGFKPRN